jgi:hypothetical protein
MKWSFNGPRPERNPAMGRSQSRPPLGGLRIMTFHSDLFLPRFFRWPEGLLPKVEVPAGLGLGRLLYNVPND